MTDPVFPSRWPYVGAQNIDLSHTNDSRGMLPPAVSSGLLGPTIRGDNSRKTSIATTPLNSVAKRHSSSKENQKGDQLDRAREKRAHKKTSKFDFVIAKIDRRTVEDRIA